MLRHLSIFRVYNLVSPGNCICRRNFARKSSFAGKTPSITPTITNPPPANRTPWAEVDFEDIDAQTREEFGNPEMNFEPQLDEIGPAYDDYMHEKQMLHLKIKRTKVIKRHFKEHEQQKQEININLLTWAEKSNIQYLHKTDPDRWIPEAIADAFPITVTGAEKLLRSKLTLRTPEEIARHDDHVKRRIHQIKSGLIELTPELQEKMEIREKIPFNIGGMPVSTKQLALIDAVDDTKPLGQFARIIASAKKIREADEQRSRSSRDMRRSEQVDDLFDKEMYRLNVRKRDKFTLSEFEEKLKTSPPPPDGGSTLKEFMPEVGYLLNLSNKNKFEPTNPSEIVLEEAASSTTNGATSKSNTSPTKFTKITKFKRNEESSTSQKERVAINNGEPYMYTDKTGYEKPFNTPIIEKIEIPEGQRSPGATYRVGDCYYDEDGDFLYRVI